MVKMGTLLDSQSPSQGMLTGMYMTVPRLNAKEILVAKLKFVTGIIDELLSGT